MEMRFLAIQSLYLAILSEHLKSIFVVAELQVYILQLGVFSLKFWVYISNSDFFS